MRRELPDCKPSLSNQMYQFSYVNYKKNYTTCPIPSPPLMINRFGSLGSIDAVFLADATEGLAGLAPAIVYALADAILAVAPGTDTKNLTESRCPWKESWA